MRRVTHYTGETLVIEIYGEAVLTERTQSYLECGRCGYMSPA